MKLQGGSLLKLRTKEMLHGGQDAEDSVIIMGPWGVHLELRRTIKK
jgi:hypothetical protein